MKIDPSVGTVEYFVNHLEDSIIARVAKEGFEAYNQQAGGKTWDNKDIPPWEEVGDRVRANWKAATRGILISSFKEFDREMEERTPLTVRMGVSPEDAEKIKSMPGFIHPDKD